MEIRKVTDPSFGVYGKVLKGYGFDRMLKEMGHTPVPDDGVIYVGELLKGNQDWKYSVTEDEVRASFSLIGTEWSAGDN